MQICLSLLMFILKKKIKTSYDSNKTYKVYVSPGVSENAFQKNSFFKFNNINQFEHIKKYIYLLFFNVGC